MIRDCGLLAWGICGLAAFGPMHSLRATAQCVDGWTAAGVSALSIHGLVVFDDGSGPRLCASGTSLHVPGGPGLSSVAAWDGVKWSSVGNYPSPPNGILRLHVITLDGSAGLYLTVTQSSGVAKWDGVTWKSLGNPGPMFSLTAFDDGAGPLLFGSGWSGVRKYSGTSWTTVGNAPSQYGPTALAVFDDGSGEALYFGGFYSSVSGVPAKGIAKWDGVAWSDVGGGVTGQVAPPTPPGVETLAAFQGKLYAGGVFTHAGGVYVESIAAWDGKAWSAVGGALDEGKEVWQLRVIDDGGGPALYAVGSFSHVAGVPVNNIAKWNGANWSAIGGGIATPNAFVQDVAYFSNGVDSALFASGNIAYLGNSNASNGLARYWCVCADLTGDGFVGQDDLAVLLAAFGVSGGGDIDKDGDTDQADLGALLQQYGTACE